MAGDFGTGLAVGFAIGIPSGLIIGSGCGDTSSKERIKKQLMKALDDNLISIVSSDGSELSLEQLFDLLNNMKI
jgi:hypothetical protein